MNMQQVWLIALIEMLVVLLIVLLVLLGMNLRRKKRRLAAINLLIDDVTDSQGQRKQKLATKLSREFKLNNQSAQVLSDVLLTAEKTFLQHFIEQQIRGSVDGFYENLCLLLENYMQVMAEGADHAALSVQASSSPAGEEFSDDDLMPERVSSIFGEKPPDWGDVFD
jgi:hypothetical protein